MYTFVQMVISILVFIMLYIWRNILLVNTNFDSEEQDADLKQLSSINLFIIQMFVSREACIILYIPANILLMNTNFDSEEPDSGLKNLSSIYHIIQTKEYLLYICTNFYINHSMYHALYLYEYILVNTKFYSKKQMMV